MCQLILCSVLVNIWTDFNKIGWPVLQGTINKTKLCKKCPLHLKYVLGKFEVTEWAVKRSTYMCILMNHRIATKRLAVIVSKNVKRVVSHIIFTSYARNICLQYKSKHVIAAATSPTARSTDSVIQTVHSFCCIISVRRHLRSWFTLEADISST